MKATDRTPADLLRSALSEDPARPLVTFYDDATGERVELSVATFANWVAKTANLLQGELSAEPGERVALLLPAHWQTAVWLLACSSVGVVADVGGDPAAADHVVAGPGRFEAGLACSGERVALSLAPLGRRFQTPPVGYADYAVEVPSQGDRFAPYAPVDPEEQALIVAGAAYTGAEVVEQARADAPGLDLTGPGSRILSALSYDTWAGLAAGLYAPLATGGSVVLCRNLDQLGDDSLARRIESERVTATARQGLQG
ncbi:TIGR03089 family protein [Streptomyces rhizosphaerihabitans]|uniref:TIGR03089 family protein n=1 Tax=Streptomyces rhizosphaerihabitans TaxID=1266770 RepID=UPI0021C047D1|nr:TIGR03089 family protein [Streptomyces rhizosphaerihabitans]MCT9005660.1 TIGR03089 family protein [Streptomyces rhizosphaerihabitans]